MKCQQVEQKEEKLIEEMNNLTRLYRNKGDEEMQMKWNGSRKHLQCHKYQIPNK